MAKQTTKTSIRKVLISAVMLVTALCLSLSISISTYLDVKEQKQLIINKLDMIADIVSFNAQITLIFEDRKTEEKRLKSFSKVPLVKNIHIYDIDDVTKKPVFFTSYNASKTPPVPLKVDSIDVLKQPRITDDHIELIKPVEYEGKIEGYIYIRGSLERLNKYINNKILIDILLTLFVLLLVSLVARGIQRRIAEPIEELSLLLQDVSKNHNYSTRAASSKIEELNYLSNNLNIMLSRTQNQIERHEADKQEINKLNQSLEEKMASLGQMVAGVAHEVNTPIGLGVTGSTLLRDKLADIQTAFEMKTLTSKQLEKFISDGVENLDLIYRNLNRAADLISNFKRVAVSQDFEISADLNVKSLLSNILMAMNAEISVKSPDIQLILTEELTISSKTGPLQQIFEQLISNSLIHGFETEKNNIIRIEAQNKGSNLELIYSDNGTGMPSSIRSRIFDPFVTTKRGEGGSGLGMHLVYNLVTQALNGSISLDEEYDNGTRFIIFLPLGEHKS